MSGTTLAQRITLPENNNKLVGIRVFQNGIGQPISRMDARAHRFGATGLPYPSNWQVRASVL